MIQNKKISLVLPCYNEEEGLRAIFKNDLSLIDEIIVVDNNSTDNTVEVAKNFNCVVVEEKNPGYGAAYQSGFKKATGDIIIAMDGDGTYPIKAARDFAEKIIKDNVDFISGNRLKRGKPSSMSPLNYIGNLLLTFAVRIFFIKNIEDSQSGMWVLRRAVLDKLKLTSYGMAFSQEIKIEAVDKKFKFIEIPIEYNKRLGQVKLNCFRDGFKNLMFLLKRKFN